MAHTLVNLSGYQWGVESAETGINIRSYSVNYRPEFKEVLQDRENNKIGFAVGEPEAEISVEGEVSGSTGLMAATFAAATTIANDHAEFGVSSGGVYLDDATVGQERAGWRDAQFTLSKNKGIT